jgi:hypothetical protein
MLASFRAGMTAVMAGGGPAMAEAGGSRCPVRQ